MHYAPQNGLNTNREFIGGVLEGGEVEPHTQITQRVDVSGDSLWQVLVPQAGHDEAHAVEHRQ